jgi:hypothetical protein
MEQDKQKIDSEHLQKLAAPTPLMAAVVEANKAKPQRRQSEVPQFNLAEQIMAQQRKATAVKRKAPAVRVGPVQSPVMSSKPRSSLVSIAPHVSNHAKIVADIVARDIRKLCRGKSVVAS